MSRERAAGAAALIVADDALAEQVFSGHADMAVREVPEPDVDAIVREAARIAEGLEAGVRLAVTLKSKFCLPNLDRYAEALRRSEAASYAIVASVEDGIRLRLHGVTQRIALLYVQDPALAPLFETFNLEPGVPGTWWLDQVHRRTSAAIPMHVWMDTGLGREGVMPDEALSLVTRLRPGAFAGLATHLASAPYRYPDGSTDRETEASDAIVADQLARFEGTSASLDGAGVRPQFRHVLASSGLQQNLRHASYDMVRPGRLIVERMTRRTRKTLVVRARVTQAAVAAVKELPAGWNCGYFSGETLRSARRVAVLTTGAGTLFGGGPVSIVKAGRRHVLPVDLAHGGMCVVRTDDVAVEAGDRIDLNPPSGLLREYHVPLDARFDGRLHDPLRDRTLTLNLRRRLSLRFQPADCQLVATAAHARYRSGGAIA